MAALTPNRMKVAEFVRNLFVAAPPAGTTLEQIQDGEYWKNIQKQLHISDRIEVIPEDGAYFAELYVTNVTQYRIGIKLLRSVVLDDAAAADAKQDVDDNPFEVKFRGPIAKHSVQRKKTKEVLKDGFNSKSDALAWLSDYEKNSEF